MQAWMPGEGEGDRDGIGGRPYLRDTWPVCTHEMVATAQGLARCRRYGQPMSHFLRFDTRPEHGLPLPAGSHFSLFLCPACADAVLPYEGDPPWAFPEHFWESGPEPGKGYTNFSWWYASLEPPGTSLTRAETSEPHLQSRTLQPSPEPALQIGGSPEWLQGEAGYICACGAPMVLLLQIPEMYEFAVLPGAPTQRGVTWKEGEPWSVFLGNQTYVFVCARSCHPRAVMVLNQS